MLPNIINLMLVCANRESTGTRNYGQPKLEVLHAVNMAELTCRKYGRTDD